MNVLDKELERLKADGCVVDDDTIKLLRTVKSVNFANGEKCGEKRGEKRGIEIGKSETIKTIIRNMLQSGINMENIISITNADEAMVKKVAEELAGN